MSHRDEQILDISESITRGILDTMSYGDSFWLEGRICVARVGYYSDLRDLA